jgi:hypothetical protein
LRARASPGPREELCLELAEEVRETLVFLVGQIESTRASSRRFTDRMRKLLDRGNQQS